MNQENAWALVGSGGKSSRPRRGGRTGDAANTRNDAANSSIPIPAAAIGTAVGSARAAPGAGAGTAAAFGVAAGENSGHGSSSGERGSVTGDGIRGGRRGHLGDWHRAGGGTYGGPERAVDGRGGFRSEGRSDGARGSGGGGGKNSGGLGGCGVERPGGRGNPVTQAHI